MLIPIRWLPVDGCIELTGVVPEKVKNLHDLLKPEDNGKTADRLFFDLVRASQLGNIILVQAPHHVHKGDKHNKLRLAEAAQLGLEVKYVYATKTTKVKMKFVKKKFFFLQFFHKSTFFQITLKPRSVSSRSFLGSFPKIQDDAPFVDTIFETNSFRCF